MRILLLWSVILFSCVWVWLAHYLLVEKKLSYKNPLGFLLMTCITLSLMAFGFFLAIAYMWEYR